MPETQARIVRAALELFAERGFASTTTAEIARRAGVAEKTLFSHFKSKQELFEQTLTPATIQLIVPEAHAKLEQMLATSWNSTEEFLTALLGNRLEVFREHPSKFKLIVQEMLLHPEMARPFREKFQCQMEPRFDETFRRLQAKGELRDLPLAAIRRVAGSSLLGYAIGRFIMQPDAEWDDDIEIRVMVDILTNGLLPRARAPRRGSRSRAKRPAKRGRSRSR
jgi:AcrR family transcriptional regulator